MLVKQTPAQEYGKGAITHVCTAGIPSTTVKLHDAVLQRAAPDLAMNMIETMSVEHRGASKTTRKQHAVSRLRCDHMVELGQKVPMQMKLTCSRARHIQLKGLIPASEASP